MQEDSTNIPRGYCQCGCGQRTPLYTDTNKRLGIIKGQPTSFLHGHNKAKLGYRKSGPRYIEEDRGFKSPCWIWQLFTNKDGYGHYPSKTGSLLAHRRYYEHAKGSIPAGLQLDHLCRVRPCVNPEHLEPVTRTENQRRGAKAKLTLDKAEEIRRLYLHGGVSQRELGLLYGVSKHTIWGVVNYKTWIP